MQPRVSRYKKKLRVDEPSTGPASSHLTTIAMLAATATLSGVFPSDPRSGPVAQRVLSGFLDSERCQVILTGMARWGGGPETYRALNGPRGLEKNEVLFTLSSIRNVRGKVDRSELVTVQKARQIGLSWTEIATALGVTRQSAWERFHELDVDAAPH